MVAAAMTMVTVSVMEGMVQQDVAAAQAQERQQEEGDGGESEAAAERLPELRAEVHRR